MRYALYPLVALLTFASGVLCSRSFSTSSSTPEMRTVKEVQEDEWHRLFEAANMSGDDFLKKEVEGRLMCMGRDHSLQSRMVEAENATMCADGDGNLEPLAFNKAYNSLDLVLHSHEKWVSKNLDFVREFTNSKLVASRYVKTRLHLHPLY